MRMQLATWPEVETYLRTSVGVILPIGSTEQHGPTGFVGTDALTAEMIAIEVGAKIDAMVAPTISVGMAQHHLGFPGSMTLRPSTLICVIQDMINSLAHHGFERFFFLNGHGGNVATLTAAFAEVYAESSFGTAASNRPSLRCILRNWYMGEKVRKISKEAFGDDEGSHATASEVALTYFGFPNDADRVARVPLDPARAPTGTIYDADDYRRQFPDGRIGSNPGLATEALGKQLFEASVEELCEDYCKFIETA
ncbi:MAG: amidase [Magnetovibrio sp.]|nr:amidase [Magnetovibrio sp.]|tara:strand:+ start:1281 stop:2039 length:759 start_codon:yes stop_codon:yes gene_type:complete